MKLKPSTDFAWVWVVDFPLFEYDEEEKRYVSTHHPFTAPLDEDLAKLDSRDREVVESIKSKAYDIVVNGSEIGGGAFVSTAWTCSRRSSRCSASTTPRRKLKFGFLLDALNTAPRRTAASRWGWIA